MDVIFLVWYQSAMHEPGKRMSAWIWALAGCAFVALYVLGAGPVEWLSHRDMLPEPVGIVLQIAYGPLSWLFLHGPEPVRDLMQWYVDLWVP